MEIFEIAQKIQNVGGTLYLVGGAVRDKLMNVQSKDEDFCVTGITKQTFIELFPQAILRGKDFEVFDIEHREFALARKEIKIGIGHKEFSIQTGREITIDEDLSRRDITINAIAQNVLTKEIIDPFDGKKDIQNKIIRATTNKFAEDPLRVYRVARFAAILGFSVEKNTIKLMNSLKDELNNLSKERVFEEFKKALQADKPSIFFEVLKEARVLDVHFKEIYQLIGAIQPKQYHPEGDAFEHTKIVLDNVAKLTQDLSIRFSALVHDLGKGTTPKSIYPHHYGHEERGEKLVIEFGHRLGLPNLWIKCGKISAKEHMRGGIFRKMTPSKKVSFIQRVEKSPLGLEGLQIIVIADKARLGINENNLEEYLLKNPELNFLTIGQQCIKQINGEFIMKKYNVNGLKLKEKLQEERIHWMKNLDKRVTL